jgi:hypothetical protein
MCPAGPALGLFVDSYLMIGAIDSVQSFDFDPLLGWLAANFLGHIHQSAICYTKRLRIAQGP